MTAGRISGASLVVSASNTNAAKAPNRTGGLHYQADLLFNATLIWQDPGGYLLRVFPAYRSCRINDRHVDY